MRAEEKAEQERIRAEERAAEQKLQEELRTRSRGAVGSGDTGGGT
jgi:hypothetical protein